MTLRVNGITSNETKASPVIKDTIKPKPQEQSVIGGCGRPIYVPNSDKTGSKLNIIA
jgi:hypothetical protein